MPDMILALSSDVSLDVGGGKAANLARLVRAGLPVPPGFVITTRAYREHLSRNNLEPGIYEIAGLAQIEEPASLDAASAAIRARFASLELPSSVSDAIGEAYAALGRPPVAVRSSATTEDLPELSFAGQHDTLLNVIGNGPLVRAVVHCWSSLWTARAIAYRVRNGIAHAEAALAVVVQRMIPADVSGVLFTANPLTGKRSETVIDATFGLGEALVSGRVEPDHFVVDDSTGRVLTRQIGAKAMSIRARPDGGTLEASEDATDRPTMTDSEVLELASLCRRVVTLFGTPQDIEWARAAGAFHLLQARPITSLFPLPAGLPDGLHILLSIGAIQGMLDPITPLGRDVFRVALPRALASIGAPFAVGRNPVVVAGERIFVDITGAAQRPPVRARLRRVLSVIEPMTGEALDELFADRATDAAGPRLRFAMPAPHFLVLLARALGNLTYDLLWPDRGRARIQRRLAATIAAFERRSAAAHALPDRLALLEQAFAWIPHTGLPLLAPGFDSGLANLNLLHALTARLPDGERRLLELTRGLPHNVTTEMDLALWGVASAIRSDSHAAAHFAATDPVALARESIAGRLPRAAQTAIDAFLRTYGMRGVGEIDLGRARWRDDPTPLMQVLQSYLRIEDVTKAPDAVFRRGAESAERALASLIVDARRPRFGRLKGFVIKLAARRMRALAGLRESPKFTMITMLGVVRDSLLVGGRELVAMGILDSPDDVFFLDLDELTSVGGGGRRIARLALDRAGAAPVVRTGEDAPSSSASPPERRPRVLRRQGRSRAGRWFDPHGHSGLAKCGRRSGAGGVRSERRPAHARRDPGVSGNRSGVDAAVPGCRGTRDGSRGANDARLRGCP